MWRKEQVEAGKNLAIWPQESQNKADKPEERLEERQRFIMKISGRKSVSQSGGLSGSRPSRQQEKADGIQRVEQAADVEFSESVQELEKARELLNAMPDVRAEKIAAIKPLVEQGSYQVSGKKTARKIVNQSLRESARLHKKNG